MFREQPKQHTCNKTSASQGNGVLPKATLQIAKKHALNRLNNVWGAGGRGVGDLNKEIWGSAAQMM